MPTSALRLLPTARSTSVIRAVPGSATQTRTPTAYCVTTSREEPTSRASLDRVSMAIAAWSAKGGDEVNLLVGERPHVGAGEAQDAYWDALAQHGNSEHGAHPNPVESEVRFGIHIGNVNSTAFEQGASGDTAALWPERHVSPAFHEFGGEAV